MPCFDMPSAGAEKSLFSFLTPRGPGVLISRAAILAGGAHGFQTPRQTHMGGYGARNLKKAE